jgi:thiol-disulfide isomerase/thioredoxin
MPCCGTTLRRRDALILAAVGAAAAGAGLVAGALALQSGSGAATLLSSAFPDLSGRPRRLLEWQGRILLCNFWATWCAPCREEMPMLARIREKYASKSVEFVGIGVDSADKMREFVKEHPVSYPILVASAAAIDLMRSLGNVGGALPFTVVLDRAGTVGYRKLGTLSQAELEGVLAGFLR